MFLMNLLSNKILKIYHDYCDFNMELKSLNSNYSAACFIYVYIIIINHSERFIKHPFFKFIVTPTEMYILASVFF